MSTTTTFPAYPTVAELVASIQQQIELLDGLITNFNTGGVTETYLEAIAVALGSDASTLPNNTIQGAYEALAALRNAEYILTATGSDLDNKAADVGVTRKVAVAATGQVQFSQNPPPAQNLTIPAGFVVSAEPADPAGAPILYTTQAAITYLAGQANSPLVAISAQNAGSAGNVPAGAINTCISSNPGGLTVTNPQATAGGADVEGDDSPNGGLRARALAAIPNASQCTIVAIQNAALSYAGVTSAVLKDNTASDGVTFERGVCQLYVDDGSGNMGANNPTLINTIQTDFTNGKYRAAGVQVYVHGSTQAAVTVALTYNPSLAYIQSVNTQASVDAAVQAAVLAYISALPIGRAATIAGIIDAVENVPGVANVVVSSVKINGSNADFVPSVSQSVRCTHGLTDITITDGGTVAQYG